MANVAQTKTHFAATPRLFFFSLLLIPLKHQYSPTFCKPSQPASIGSKKPWGLWRHYTFNVELAKKSGTTAAAGTDGAAVPNGSSGSQKFCYLAHTASVDQLGEDVLGSSGTSTSTYHFNPFYPLSWILFTLGLA